MAHELLSGWIVLNPAPTFPGLVLLATGALLAACATAPTRPTLLEVPAGAPLVELSTLPDADIEDGVVDVTLLVASAASLPVLARAQVGNAVVVRGLTGGFQQVGDERAAVDGGVALFNPQRPGAFAIRSGVGARVDAILLVAEATKQERVLVLDDRAQGIERLNGLGNQLVVNGQPRPTLRVTPGSMERWHVFNVAERRSFLIALPGHLLRRPDGKEAGELWLAPGESASVDVALGLPAGTSVDVTTIDADGAATTADAAEAWPLLRVLYVAQEKS